MRRIVSAAKKFAMERDLRPFPLVIVARELIKNEHLQLLEECIDRLNKNENVSTEIWLINHKNDEIWLVKDTDLIHDIIPPKDEEITSGQRGE